VFTKVNFARDHLCGFSHRGDIQLPGLDGIKRHWQRVREEHEERIAQQPRQQPREMMKVSV